MDEKELISKIESLKEIKPDQNWAFSAKKRIFGKEKSFFSFPVFSKMPFAVPAALLMLIGIFALSQHAITLNVERAEEMERIAREREIEMLSGMLEELKETKAGLRREFAQSIQSKTREETIKIARDFAPLMLEAEDKEDFLASSLGVAVEKSEEDGEVYKDIALFLIEDAQERSLTEEDRELLDQSENAFQEEDYRLAMEMALGIGRDKAEVDLLEEDKEDEEDEEFNSENEEIEEE